MVGTITSHARVAGRNINKRMHREALVKRECEEIAKIIQERQETERLGR